MATKQPSTFDRRTLLKLSAASAGAAAIGACSSNSSSAVGTGAKSIPKTLSDQEWQDRKYELKQRMRYRMDAGELVWTFDGIIYAQKGAVMIPLFNLIHCAFARIEPRLNGGFDMLSYELGFRCDVNTGERLTEFTNPFNGELVDIPFAPVGPVEVEYSPEIVIKLPETIGGSKILLHEQPDVFRQENNTIYLDQASDTKVITAGKPDRIINEITTIYGASDALLDTSKNFVATYGFNSDVSDYSRWMKMPAEFGNQTLRAKSKKIDNADDIPAKWMSIVKEIDGDIYNNPMSVLDRAEAKYLG